MMKSISKSIYLRLLLIALFLLQAVPSDTASASVRLDPATGPRVATTHMPIEQATPDASLPSGANKLYLPLLTNGDLSPTTSLPDTAPTEVLSTPQLIQQAFERGEITAAEQALYLAYALYEPESLPQQFHSNVGWYGTEYVVQVEAFMQSVSASSLDAVQQELGRLSTLAETVCDTNDGPNVFDSTHFHFTYTPANLVTLNINDYVTSM